MPGTVCARTRARGGITIVGLLLCGALIAGSQPAHASTAPSSSELHLTHLINVARTYAAKHGLALDGPMSDVARAHSAKMAAAGYLYHSNLSTALKSFT